MKQKVGDEGRQVEVQWEESGVKKEGTLEGTGLQSQSLWKGLKGLSREG